MILYIASGYIARQIAQCQKYLSVFFFAHPAKHIYPFASASSASSSAVVIGTMEMNSASPCFSSLMLIVLALCIYA